MARVAHERRLCRNFLCLPSAASPRVRSRLLLPLAYQPVLESWSLQSTQQSLQADIFVVFSSRIPWQLSSSVSRSPIESESQGLSFFTRSPIEPERKVAVPSSLTGKSQPHRSLRG